MLAEWVVVLAVIQVVAYIGFVEQVAEQVVAEPLVELAAVERAVGQRQVLLVVVTDSS